VGERNARPVYLVLGGTGFIGRVLVRRLVEAGKSVRLFVRDPTGLPKELRDLPIDVVRGDLTDPDSLDQAMPGVGVVFHLARGTGTTFADFVRTDLEPTEVVAAACNGYRIRRLIYTGAIDSLDTSRRRVITDDTPVDPKAHRRHPAARVKAVAEERLLELYEAVGLPAVILRPGIVIGPGGNPFHEGVARWSRRSACTLWGRGNQPLPLVLVDDVARALIRAAEAPNIEGATFNLVAETDVTARDYVDVLGKAIGTPIRVRARSPMRYYLNDLFDYLAKLPNRESKRRLPSYHEWSARRYRSPFLCTKAKRLLGWQPVTDRATLLREGVERPATKWVK
jgi:nucleoside-diphosphate-sugar epimerase